MAGREERLRGSARFCGVIAKLPPGARIDDKRTRVPF